MIDFSEHLEAVKSLILGDGRANELARPLMLNEPENYSLYVTATFVAFVDQEFKDDHQLPTIRAFAERMAEDFQEAQPTISAQAIEYLIRAIFDEEDLADEVSAREQVVNQNAVIRKLGNESPVIRQSLNAFLGDAAKLANAWAAEELSEEFSA